MSIFVWFYSLLRCLIEILTRKILSFIRLNWFWEWKSVKKFTTPEVPKRWVEMQQKIHKLIIEMDTEEWQKLRLISQHNSTNVKELRYVAGVDISYAKEGKTACAAIVVCEMPQMNVVYHHCQLKEITVPYITGFLTFREVMPYLDVLMHLLIEAPQFKPQVILVDGNGRLHPREVGLACHLGVLADLPAIGVAKNILHMNNLRDFSDKKFHFMTNDVPLVSTTGQILGMAIRTGNATKPIFVSIGHKISVETAVWLVKLSSKYRIPEPIRQADIKSREFLARHPHLKTSSKPKED